MKRFLFLRNRFEHLPFQRIQNAHGNNIVVNDKGGIISDRITREETLRMQDTLGVDLVQIQIAGYHTVGSCCIATNKGFLTHFKTSEEEFSAIESALKVRGSKELPTWGQALLPGCNYKRQRLCCRRAATSALNLEELKRHWD